MPIAAPIFLNSLAAIDVIDRCWAFLSIVFGHLVNDLSQDLGKAIQIYVAKGKEDAHSSAAHIVARIHPRGKPNEQKHKNLRAPNDADAQLAVRSVGLILTDLGWAREEHR